MNNRLNKLLYRTRHPEKFLACRAKRMRRIHAKRYKDLKEQMLALLGGKCACCGESNSGFLTLDHIAPQTGRYHRKSKPKTYEVWREVIQTPNARENYRLLCWNCNCTTSYGKVCPHNIKEVEAFLSICQDVSTKPFHGQLEIPLGGKVV